MSVLKWIYGILRKVVQPFLWLVNFLSEIFSSVLAWAIAGLVYLLHSVYGWLGDFFEGLFENAAGISLGTLQVPPLARWIAKDLLALDVAWECLAIFIGVWIASRLARASFSFVRLVLDLL